MSSADNEFHALGRFRPFLVMLTIYNRNNFRGKNRRMVMRNIARAIGFSILVAALIGVIISASWFCSNKHFKLGIVAEPLSILLGSIQVVCIYLSISSKSRQINAVLEHLDVIIRKRKQHSNLCHYEHWQNSRLT